MRVLLFHGYLLRGTGSNVYTACLAEALVRLGAEVHLLAQERHADELGFVDAVGDWDSGALRVRALRERVRCTVYRPDIGPLLPVYVEDRYEGIEARTFARSGDAEIERYLQANVRAVREVAELVGPELALANHLIIGPAVLARALGGEVPYAVKIHGSALEYTVKAEPGRFLGYAREGLAGARGVLVGSSHTARSLWATLDDEAIRARTRLGPPGVDVGRWRPLAEHAGDGSELLARLTATLLAAKRGDRAGAAARADAFARDPSAAAAALGRLSPTRPLVAFVGKLIVSKGVDLLLAAWPLVLQRAPAAQLVVVGFGAFRDGLEALLGALGSGDIAAARELARDGRARESPDGGPPLRHLLAFLDELRGDALARYLAAAAALGERVVFTGRLEHDELGLLLALCDAAVVPSTFPESFGMIAVEAAACGALPVSARHSGLAEVSEALARALPEAAARLLSFPVGDTAVAAIADRVGSWLETGPQVRRAVRGTLVATVRERYSWEGVARGVLAAARGELELLDRPLIVRKPPATRSGRASPGMHRSSGFGSS